MGNLREGEKAKKIWGGNLENRSSQEPKPSGNGHRRRVSRWPREGWETRKRKKKLKPLPELPAKVQKGREEGGGGNIVESWKESGRLSPKY